ncbi:MAG: GspH/FimT family pseudopilin [Halothiobacillaceae bacterium]
MSGRQVRQTSHEFSAPGQGRHDPQWRKPFHHRIRPGFGQIPPRGLTVLELMISLAIGAILLSVAVPGMSRLAETSRLTATHNELLYSIYMARSEAVKRGHRVSVCPSEDGQTCADSDWDAGWIVFDDPAASLTPAADDIIRVVPEPGPINITGNQPVERYISYLPSGRSARLSGALQMGTVTLCSPSGMGRQVVINAAGRPRMQDSAC